MDINHLSFTLLKEWCDTLISQQITDNKSKGIYGGILCEACGYIHGRIADAIYPLITLYAKTGNEKYLKSAERVFIWQKNNVRRFNNLNINDTFNLWHGVTEFYLISLGETLLAHGNIFPKETYTEWLSDFKKVAKACYKLPTFLHSKTSSVATNYIVAYPTAMAIAYKVTGEEDYMQEALSCEENIFAHISPDGHFYGEAGGLISNANGHKNIDLGYNIEESVCNFALYGKIMQRENVLDVCTDMVKNALPFMLPDGAWDNSWGSRGIKWTYYGSRTSDGCQTVLAILADRDPSFVTALKRNTELMQSMTYNGLLSGGKMYESARMLPCNHHAFTHAKSLAYIVNNPVATTVDVKLPCDSDYGFADCDSAGVTRISMGNFNGTITATSLSFAHEQSIKGGHITCLYHKKYGVIFVANGLRFSNCEPTNMQPVPDLDNFCQTMRIDNGEYSSMLCENAKITKTENRYTAVGKLTDFSNNTSDDYTISYEFLQDELTVTAIGNGTLWLPIVCDFGKDMRKSENTITFDGISITCDNTLNFKENVWRDRIFNTTGGFASLPIYINLTDGIPCNIKIKIC